MLNLYYVLLLLDIFLCYYNYIEERGRQREEGRDGGTEERRGEKREERRGGAGETISVIHFSSKKITLLNPF